MKHRRHQCKSRNVRLLPRVAILHRIAKSGKVGPQPAHKRAFLLFARPERSCPIGLRIGPNIWKILLSQIRPFQGLGLSAKGRYHPSPTAPPSSRGRRLSHFAMKHRRHKVNPVTLSLYSSPKAIPPPFEPYEPFEPFEPGRGEAASLLIKNLYLFIEKHYHTF